MSLLSNFVSFSHPARGFCSAFKQLIFMLENKVGALDSNACSSVLKSVVVMLYLKTIYIQKYSQWFQFITTSFL